MDVNKKKGFGPRPLDSAVGELDMEKVLDGSDVFINDFYFLRFAVGSDFNMEKVMNALRFHLQWR